MLWWLVPDARARASGTGRRASRNEVTLTSFCDRYDYHRAHGRYPEDELEVETAEVPAEDTTSKVVKPKRSTPRSKTSDVAETKAAESEE